MDFIHNHYKVHFINNLKKTKLVLFGASQLGIKVLNILKRKNVNVDFFCDNNSQKWNTELCGIKVISPAELAGLDKNLNIIITSMWHKEIINQLHKLGFYNVIYFKDIDWYLLLYLDFYYFDSIINHQDEINRLMHILEDNRSVDVVKNIIEHRLTCNFKYILNITDDCHIDYMSCEKKQYLDRDIIKLDDKEIFVDAGSYTGDTITAFINEVKGIFNKIYAFEPDPRNFYELNKIVQKLAYKNKIEIMPYGLYDSNTYFSFDSEKKGSSCISLEGRSKVKLVKLDDIINEEVTFIKMDIEGAEINALIGARKIIEKFKPKLAVCLYHKPNDLWEIPLFIKSIVPEYKIYIRHYSMDIGETVCYAVV
jgi:FkbM family methyltransferase